MENLGRFEGLRNSIADYEQKKRDIRTGIEDEARIKMRRDTILDYFSATEADWASFEWQIKNRIKKADDLKALLELTGEEASAVEKISRKYRFAISPYYLSLIDEKNPCCPIKLQSVPCSSELLEIGELDPMDESGSKPVEGVTRRYPDRLIIKTTNMCGMYCRFCQRRRRIGEEDVHLPDEHISEALDYIRANSEIRDVLITGGDALMLSDGALERILTALRAIEHVEIIRIGTRAPVTIPQRITPELTAMLKRFHPLYVNVHFNSPMEITRESKAACEALADAGIPLGNQMVLLRDINNDPFVVRKLNQELLRIRVRPYYIFHPKNVIGTSHFWVKIEEGLEIMDSLRGFTSGLAIPTYIVNGPCGLGKTPLLPSYLLYLGKDKAVLRSWEGKVFSLPN